MHLDIPEIEVKICTHTRLGKVPRSHKTCDEDSVEQILDMAICEGLRGPFDTLRVDKSLKIEKERTRRKAKKAEEPRYGLIRASVPFCFLLELQVRMMSRSSL